MNGTRTFQAIFFLPFVLLLASCAAVQPVPTATPTLVPTPVPSPTFTATPAFPLPEGVIVFEIEPTRKFAGHVYGQGQTAIILANMGQGGESQWDPFVKAVDKKKFTVIAFNYLQVDMSGAPQAVLTVFARVRDVGYKRVICIGASLGVSACGSIALEPELVGMASLAGPNLTGVNTRAYPKLFIAAEGDPISSDTLADYKAASEPKQLVLYKDTAMHGTNLFYSQYRDQIIQTMVDFINGLAGE